MYVKRVELTNFKSFGGTTPIPLMPGFTVISGPNGSGKSNLLDALLFCLGLAGSKGMRAERLPDLVNNTQTSRRSTVEAAVTVTFDLSDELHLLHALHHPEDETEPSIAQAESGQALTVELDANGLDTNGLDTNGLNANGLDVNEGNGSNGKNGKNGTSANGNGKNGSSADAEWSVTRKLRVTPQGTYTSNYFINGESCTLTELHDQLNKLRVYPEGYNVVLQGDVTRIISMNGRERREIIDELAGVAAFDRKINQAKDKLDAVKDQEDKFHIVEKELTDQRDRLAQDRIKAEKYQKLRAEMQTKELWEVVIRFQVAEQQVHKLQSQIQAGEKDSDTLTSQTAELQTQITQTTAELEQLNRQVRALGEEEQIALQSTLATREAELRQLQRQDQDLQAASRELTANLARSQQELHEQTQTLVSLTEEQAQIETADLVNAQQQHDDLKQALEQRREAASHSAASAEAWVQEQTRLHHDIETLTKILDPQRTEQARLREKTEQLQRQIQEHTTNQTTIGQQRQEQQAQQIELTDRLTNATEQVQTLARSLSQIEEELQIQQQTQQRLLQEQRENQRKLDKLEAQAQATQEIQGTHASQMILQMGLSGVHGLVAQLGQVEPRYQLALETAAGGRMANIVVEDDAIAAAAIEILKQKRGGRATFLPMNKIHAPQIPNRATLRSLQGCVDYAVNLIDYDRQYERLFAYVFGSTIVFETLDAARRHLGKSRIVTLDGELLEASGAMTGGSINQRSSLRFGNAATSESPEVLTLRSRLEELDRMLAHCERTIGQILDRQKQQTQAMAEARQQHRELQLKAEQLQTELQRLTTQDSQLTTQLQQSQQDLAATQTKLQTLDTDIPQQVSQLEQLRQTLADLEQSQTHSEWQQIQAGLRSIESELNQKEVALRTIEQRLQDLETQRQRLQERLQQGQGRIQEYRQQQTGQLQQQSDNTSQQTAVSQQITELKAALNLLDQTLIVERQKRDTVDRQLREQQTQQQQLHWQQQQLQEAQQARRTQLTELQADLATQRAELPDPLPEIPDTAPRDIHQLQHEIRSLQRRLQAMEPVNMLALEEYDRTQARLEELSDKLHTLQEERTELLLRIETFTTLRQRSFMEAYAAVDENFQKIFAVLSDGDGRLQLEDAEDPFNGGLNLIAHPKGKPVQRLASMSGGEKSLTALSFIFALQRYRPSPFYAFDEVDMFLDGANVERLAKMIKQQAQQAQFIVVSLRRPMIESAERTIGVTQARGAHTQVLGIKLPQSASV